MKLLQTINGKNFINGKWIGCDNQKGVVNPSTNQIITNIPYLNKASIEDSIKATIKGFQVWSESSIYTRVTFLRNWHRLILEHSDELAHIITLENGKTLADSKGEVKYAASFVEWYADLLPSLEGSIKNGASDNHKIIVEYESIGPVAAITPWNFPIAMVTRKLAPALAAGCSVLLKPSELTPCSALACALLAQQAEIPAGVINVITGNSKDIGEEICNSPGIRKLSFTGSTAVGKILFTQSATTLKKLSLELGGNAPVIVNKDVEIEKCVSDLIIAKIRSNGQSCISPNRVFIHTKIYQNFMDILKEKFLKLKAGDGFDPASDIGPLINKAAIDKISALLQDAVQKGGILFGGNINGNFLSPAILENASSEMEIFRAEIFGAVIPCYQFTTLEEAITLANDTEYGLQAYVYSRDIAIAQKLAHELDFGMVSINSGLPSNAAAPFGGRKYSGFGVEGGKAGLFEYLNTKYINLNYLQ